MDRELRPANYENGSGVAELQKMLKMGVEIPLLRYKGYMVTYDYDHYIFYGKDNCAIGRLPSLMDACIALVVYGNDTDVMGREDSNQALAFYDGVAELLEVIRGF